MTSIALRPITEHDIPALRKMLLEPEIAAAWGPYDEERLRADMLSEGTHAFMILAPDEVGAVTVYESDDAHCRYAHMDVFVRPRHRWKGIGTQAIRATIAWLLDRGHHRITIDVPEEDGASAACYRKCGFQDVGVMHRYKWRRGRWADNLLMEWIKRT